MRETHKGMKSELRNKKWADKTGTGTDTWVLSD